LRLSFGKCIFDARIVLGKAGALWIVLLNQWLIPPSNDCHLLHLSKIDILDFGVDNRGEYKLTLKIGLGPSTAASGTIMTSLAITAV